MPSIAQLESGWQSSTPFRMRNSGLGRLLPGSYLDNQEEKSGLPMAEPPPYTGSSVASTLANSGSGLASGLLGSAWSLPMAGANILSSGVKSVSDYFQNKERLAQSKEFNDMNWDAAKRAGLYSPAQFNGINAGVGTMIGRKPIGMPRLAGPSNYGF